MRVVDQALVERCSAALSKALRGDASANRAILDLKARADAGDPAARRAFNTLRSLHWNRRVGQAMYAKAEKFYHRLLHGDQAAHARVRHVLSLVKQGHPEATKAFRTLKSIHHKYKASAWSGPGAPKIGHYPMPNIHRAGIEIPGLGNFPTPWDPPPPPPTPLQQLGQLAQQGLQGAMQYLPLDQNALARLLQLIAFARMAPPPFPFPMPMVRSVEPQYEQDFPMTQTMPKALAPNTVTSSVPRSSSLSTVSSALRVTAAQPTTQATLGRGAGITSAPRTPACEQYASLLQAWGGNPTIPMQRTALEHARQLCAQSTPTTATAPCTAYENAVRAGQSAAIIAALKAKCEASRR